MASTEMNKDRNCNVINKEAYTFCNMYKYRSSFMSRGSLTVVKTSGISYVLEFVCIRAWHNPNQDHFVSIFRVRIISIGSLEVENCIV